MGIIVMFLGETERRKSGFSGPLYPGAGEVVKRIPKKLGEAYSEDRSLSPIHSGKVDPPTCPKCQGRMKIISFIEDEEVFEKILKHLGLWDVKAQPPPRAKAPSVTIHIDDSYSQISSFDPFYATA